MALPPARVVALGLACVLLALPLYEDLAQVWSDNVVSNTVNTARETKIKVGLDAAHASRWPMSCRLVCSLAVV